MPRFYVVRNFNLTRTYRRQAHKSSVLEAKGVETSREVKKDETSSEKTNERHSSSEQNKKKQVFWMKDPKTGYWIPETHFGGGINVPESRH
ncbi:hypothetical protein RND81_05G241300 [Saponaria officinalis]|uniref:Late embryogenesis abundant protein n=1 Tax=Saponaria officinalis TaxID=3572 RepID=A0AAW1L182_SAPOF